MHPTSCCELHALPGQGWATLPRRGERVAVGALHVLAHVLRAVERAHLDLGPDLNSDLAPERPARGDAVVLGAAACQKWQLGEPGLGKGEGEGVR
eukprot:scaffold15953_cov51-Phaeocystis_antarctica.AAC.1